MQDWSQWNEEDGEGKLASEMLRYTNEARTCFLASVWTPHLSSTFTQKRVSKEVIHGNSFRAMVRLGGLGLGRRNRCRVDPVCGRRMRHWGGLVGLRCLKNRLL